MDWSPIDQGRASLRMHEWKRSLSEQFPTYKNKLETPTATTANIVETVVTPKV
jgi:hypothetical protein